ncbi:MAG: diacylglycerol kinase family protein [Polyangia bacterium]
MASRQVLLVGNPTAQSGRNAERIERATSLFRARGITPELITTEPEGRTISKIVERLHAREPLTLVSMGGDGTFAEVARALYASGRSEEVPLAMLPTGTANDQGKSFGLDAEEAALERNIEVVLEARETRLDVGHLRTFDAVGTLVTEELFFDSAGWGISPRTLQLRNEDRAAIAQVPILRAVYRDQLVYAGALLRTFLSSYVEEQKFDVEIEANGQYRVLEGLTDLIVKGTRIYGGMWVCDEASRHDDGRFEIVPFQGKRDWISKALVMLKGSKLDLDSLSKIGLQHSEGLSASCMRLHIKPRSGGTPVVAQLDGDVFVSTADIRIDVIPRALRLVVPRDHADERRLPTGTADQNK